MTESVVPAGNEVDRSGLLQAAPDGAGELGGESVELLRREERGKVLGETREDGGVKLVAEGALEVAKVESLASAVEVRREELLGCIET